MTDDDQIDYYSLTILLIPYLFKLIDDIIPFIYFCIPKFYYDAVMITITVGIIDDNTIWY